MVLMTTIWWHWWSANGLATGLWTGKQMILCSMSLFVNYVPPKEATLLSM